MMLATREGYELFRGTWILYLAMCMYKGDAVDSVLSYVCVQRGCSLATLSFRKNN